jgi:hypothetical protein
MYLDRLISALGRWIRPLPISTRTTCFRTQAGTGLSVTWLLTNGYLVEQDPA